MLLHFYHPKLRKQVASTVATCDACQRNKNVGRGHGHVAPREASAHPWRHVAVDLIGPWTLENHDGTKVSFSALTIIDEVTNLVEVVRIQNKTAAHVAQQFVYHWLSRYPRPMSVKFDQGGEFVGYHFLAMLEFNGIQKRPTTIKNPRSNSICERMHQAVGNVLRTLRAHHQAPAGIASLAHLVDTAIATCVYATRSALHSELKATPGSLAFGRDMLLDIPLIADLTTIRDNRQQPIDRRLVEANRKRFAHDYQPGDEVLRLVYKPDKLDSRAKGPYVIDRVHTNGTITLRIDANTTERISIRNVKPYFR